MENDYTRIDEIIECLRPAITVVQQPEEQTHEDELPPGLLASFTSWIVMSVRFQRFWPCVLLGSLPGKVQCRFVENHSLPSQSPIRGTALSMIFGLILLFVFLFIYTPFEGIFTKSIITFFITSFLGRFFLLLFDRPSGPLIITLPYHALVRPVLWLNGKYNFAPFLSDAMIGMLPAKFQITIARRSGCNEARAEGYTESSFLFEVCLAVFLLLFLILFSHLFELIVTGWVFIFILSFTLFFISFSCKGLFFYIYYRPCGSLFITIPYYAIIWPVHWLVSRFNRN